MVELSIHLSIFKFVSALFCSFWFEDLDLFLVKFLSSIFLFNALVNGIVCLISFLFVVSV